MSLAALATAIDMKKYLLTSDPEELKSASLSRRRAERSLRPPPGLYDAIDAMPWLPLLQVFDDDDDDDDDGAGGADNDDVDNNVDTGVDLLVLLLVVCFRTSITDDATATISSTISTTSIATVNTSIIKAY